MITKIILFLLLTLNIAFSAQLNIEPVYGVERSYQKNPEPGSYRTETFYGVRGTYGFDRIAGELELNQSNNSFTTGETKSETETQKALLGARLVPFAAKFYSIYLRGGVRAQKINRTLTTNGETINGNEALTFDPYAGSGLTLNLAGILSLNTSATLVYNKNAPSSEQYDTRYTFSVTFKFGSQNVASF